MFAIKDFREKEMTRGSRVSYFLKTFGVGTPSPGEMWEGSGPKYLLGYAFSAPTDGQGSDAAETNFTVLSFVFTTNAAKPKVTFLYSCLRGQITIKEQITLTMIDTAAGWKIDAVDNQEVQ